jgi:DNA-directed RNA polymerase, mitochondrial
MYQLGADRQELMNNRRKAGRMESLSKYGEIMTSAGVAEVITFLKHHIKQMEGGKAGPKYTYLTPLSQIPPAKAAATAMRVVVDQLSQTSKLHALAYEVAEKLWMEAMLHKATPFERKRHKKVRRRFRLKRLDVLRMQNTMIWTPPEKLSTGVFLIYLVARHTGLITIETRREGVRTVKFVRATDACLDYAERVHEASKLLCPFSLPMVVPPRPWSSVVEGGYLTDIPNNVLLKEGSLLVADRSTGEEPFIKAANLQQGVAWKINRWVLEHLEHAWTKSLHIGKLMPREGFQVPPYPKHLPDDHPDVTQWKFNARRIHDQNDASRNRRIATAKQLWVANRLVDEPELYFPMQLDFRGRYYYRPPFVNPQANDIGRSLLLFANGTPINTNEEADWLRIHGANLYGYSKVSWQARLDWVHEHQQDIEAVGRDPWGRAEFWTKADDPWQFLAFCRTYQEFIDHGYGYICHLPVVLDCTCSGIQHYSALLRNEEMAELVNLLPSDKPQDIYSTVLSKVLDQLRSDAAGHEDPKVQAHAESWLQLAPDRSLTKPVVMTLPYSATRRAVLQYCQEWALERTVDLYGKDGWCFKRGALAAMHYMATILYRETSVIIGPAKHAMAWFRRVGKVAGDNNVDLHWRSPAGLWVHQKYMDYRRTEIRLHHLSPVSMKLVGSYVPKGLNPQRMGNGLSPNVIHSLDASHMAFTTIDAFANGVRNLGGVHDCFMATPGEMRQLRNSVRNSFAAMYQQDWFTVITDELLQQLPEDLHRLLPERPKLGPLDLEIVRSATYFIT